MTPGAKPDPVVVGVDGAGSADAVNWATAEAAARGCTLRVVHVFRSCLATDAYGLAVPVDSFTPTRTAGHLVLQEAVTSAHSVAPDTRVSARLVMGTAAWALLDQARDAQLLVLGGRGRSGVHALLTGSIAGRVVRHSPAQSSSFIPSAANSSIRPPNGRPRTSSSASAPPRPAPPRPALPRSVSPSTRHANAGSPSPPCRRGPRTRRPISRRFPAHPARQRVPRGEPLNRHSRGGARSFPTVPVITKLVCADPVDALIATSSGAALLVVGSARRGQLRRMIGGSITRTVLRDARCPVAIVRRDRTTSGRTRAERTGGERQADPEPRSTDRVRRERFWSRRASR